jgi:nicotinate-nucleotide adenylyltransferase
MKIGLFFGSFNPVHIGHMAIANYMVEFTDIDQLWFIISPHNPLKNKKTLLSDQFRYDLLELAIDKDERFRLSDIEFRMPRPSYTIDTLTYLKEKNPKPEFVLILGTDNLKSFKKWKNHEEIVKHYKRYVYPRNTEKDIDLSQHKNCILIHAPVIEVSSSFIRDAISKEINISRFLPPKVYEHIKKMGFYK